MFKTKQASLYLCMLFFSTHSIFIKIINWYVDIALLLYVLLLGNDTFKNYL